MVTGNQLMRARVGAYNFTQRLFKLKTFSLKKNNFYNRYYLSEILAYLVSMLYYFYVHV